MGDPVVTGAALVTGATGYLGSRLARRLARAGRPVIVAKRSFSRTDRIDDLLDEVELFDLDRGDPSALFRRGVDLVLHCATQRGRGEAPLSRVLEANLLLPLRLLELSAEHGVPTFINVDTILDARFSSYAMSKRQFADWLATYSAPPRRINVALEYYYGPNDDGRKFPSRMVAELVARVERIELTPGDQKRDFVYIDDAVEAFMRVVESSARLPAGFHRFEVGSGRPVSLKEFVGLAARLAGNTTTRLDFGAIPYQQHEMMESHVDIGPLKGLGWAPRTTLEHGLRRTIEMERAKHRLETA